MGVALSRIARRALPVATTSVARSWTAGEHPLILRSWVSPPADRSRSPERSHTGDAVHNRHHAGRRVAGERYTLICEEPCSGRSARSRSPRQLRAGERSIGAVSGAEVLRYLARRIHRLHSARFRHGKQSEGDRLSDYAVAKLDDIDETSDGRCPWRPVRHHFGIASFGVATWTGRNAGDRIINEHDEMEREPGHLRAERLEDDANEDLYLVHRGRARFELDGEHVDAP